MTCEECPYNRVREVLDGCQFCPYDVENENASSSMFDFDHDKP